MMEILENREKVSELTQVPLLVQLGARLDRHGSIGCSQNTPVEVGGHVQV